MAYPLAEEKVILFRVLRTWETSLRYSETMMYDGWSKINGLVLFVWHYHRVELRVWLSAP